MSDIVERLRGEAIGYPVAEIEWPHRVLHDAADEIERLRAERDRRAKELVEARDFIAANMRDNEIAKQNALRGVQLAEAQGLLREWLEWGSQYLVDVDADGEFDISDQPITDLVMRTDAVFTNAKSPTDSETGRRDE